MRKNNTDAMFAFRVLIEKHIDGQKELHCVDQAQSKLGCAVRVSLSPFLLALVMDRLTDDVRHILRFLTALHTPTRPVAAHV